MKIKNYIINEQSSSGTTDTTPTITTIELKDALNFGCFSKERYPWFTVDAGEQPKTVTEDIVTGNGTGATITKGTKLISGTNSKKNPVYFILDKSGEPKGYYIGKIGGVRKDWACNEALIGKQNKENFITDFISKNNDYTGTTPSNFLINRVWKPVDVSTLDRSGLFKPGERIIYQKMGSLNTRIDQYPHIEAALSGAGYTLIEPPITTPEHDKGIDISRIMGGKYRPYFEELRKQGDSTIIWPKGDYLNYNKKASELSGVTTGVTPELVRDPKKVLALAKKGGLSKRDCRYYIKSLYRISQSQQDMNDDELMTIKNFVYGCYRQNTRFKSGAFGVGDELNQLVTNSSKYGIGDLVRGTGQMNESKLLKNIIKENLIKKSEQKQNKLLSENTIIVNRYKLLGEGIKPKTRKEFNKFLESVLNETTYLHSQGYDNELIKEGFMDLLQGVFGQASTGIFQYFKEQIGRWLLNKLGMDTNSWMGNIVITAIGNVPLTELHNLTNCSYLSNLLSKSIAEGAVNKIKNEQGLTGPGYDILRNSLVELAEDSAFGQKIEHKISDFICPQLQKIKGNLDGVTDKMKSNALGLGDKSKKLATSTVDKVKGLVSK